MQNTWIGIDVAKNTFEAATPLGLGCGFPNTPQGIQELIQWATTNCPGFSGHIAMESTGIYSTQIAITLHSLGQHPAIINPQQVHAYGRSFGRRNKTDKIDARLITRYANERQPLLWEPKSDACQNLKLLLEQRDDAITEQDRLTKQLSTITKPPTILTQRHKANQAYIQKLEKEIRKLEKNDHELATSAALLRTIPGVGEWTARAMIATTNNFDHFTRRSIASYCGLAPCVQHSGTYTGGGHIPHTGPRLLKKYLYMAAQSQTQTRMKTPLAQHYQHLRSQHKTGKQALCALMRKIITIARALITTQQPYNAQIHHPGFCG